MTADLRHIDTWLFDLDNTLYPVESGFMGEIERRMTAFVQKVTGLERDEAYKLQKAYLAQPNSGEIADSLGWAYFNMGDFKQAVQRLERAVSLEPVNPEINDHLGDVYWHTGRQLEARFQWLHALALDPDADKRPSIERKLAEGLDAVEAERDAQRAAERDTGQPQGGAQPAARSQVPPTAIRTNPADRTELDQTGSTPAPAGSVMAHPTGLAGDH